MVLDIITLAVLIGVVYLIFPPSSRQRKYLSALEHEKSSWVANEKALTSQCRLLKSESERLLAKVNGLELQLETVQREADQYKSEFLEARKRLIARGILKG